MKKCLLCFFVASLIGAGALQAAPILTGPQVQCSTFALPGSIAFDLIIPYATWTSPSFVCEQQDKIYSNFSAGASPTSTTLRLQVQPIGPNDFHTVTFNGSFQTNFTVSYDIAIDLLIAPTSLITRVTGDISNPSTVGAPSNFKTVFSESGATIGSLTSVAGNPGGAIATSHTALHAVDAYTANGGAAVSISNTFLESAATAAPEPLSYLLAGGGLLLLSSLRRFRRV